jgi:hypothetical protein
VGTVQELERAVDAQLDFIWQRMTKLAQPRLNKWRLYITDADISALHPRIRETDQVFAILAPKGTSLEIPEASPNRCINY